MIRTNAAEQGGIAYRILPRAGRAVAACSLFAAATCGASYAYADEAEAFPGSADRGELVFSGAFRQASPVLLKMLDRQSLFFAEAVEEAAQSSSEELRASLALTEDYRASFSHGPKPAECQKYIVLHDTEGAADATSVISWWDASGNGVAAHFVVNKDGTITQCVALDEIAHHAGFGDTGHNAAFGVEDESRDDKVGTMPIGSWASDYGMNSYSIGIEMVHVGGEGAYPEEQLAALDGLIAYIDAYYGFESEIIDHKAWRTGNSDTSPEFAEYFANYKEHRTYEAS